MSEPLSFTINLEQEQDYEFRIKFDWPRVPELLVDEPEPLGAAAGPNAARLVAGAVANCLSASLLFCMRKFKQSPGKLREDFCVVTDSIRQGIPVRVQVLDSTGRKVHEAGGGPAPAKVAAPA
jgi:hypothetical protein